MRLGNLMWRKLQVQARGAGKTDRSVMRARAEGVERRAEAIGRRTVGVRQKEIGRSLHEDTRVSWVSSYVWKDGAGPDGGSVVSFFMSHLRPVRYEDEPIEHVFAKS